MATIKINNKLIGEDNPTYIIAEIGINHNGDLNLAKELIDVASYANVDAVKFQKRHLPSLYKKELLNNTVKYEQYFQYMIPILKKVELSKDDYQELRRYTIKKKIDFICTPFDISSVDFLNNLDISAFKVASADLCNLELIEYIAKQNKPMIISTGMSYWDEIEKTVNLIKTYDVYFALLHCRSVYPVWPREVNLKMIQKLKQFMCPVGYSGHEIGITVPLVAASMGASIIEKHITLDKNMEGPDHKFSLELKELKRLVRDIRVADQAIGKTKRFILRGEIINRELFSKSLVAVYDLKVGTKLTKDMIKVQGPGKGLSPNKLDELLDKVLKRDIKAGDYFTEQDLINIEPFDLNFKFKSKWGLIARFSDFENMIAYEPKVIEFHLTQKDLSENYFPKKKYKQELIVHAPEYIEDKLLDLCSGSQKIRKESVELICKTIEYANNLKEFFCGNIKIIAHPGAMSLNTKLFKKNLKNALKRSLDEIDPNGTEVLLENLPPYPWYFGGQWKGNYFMHPMEIESFCKETGRNICFDLSHAALYCNAKNISLASYIKLVKPYIRHIHFADAYGLDGEGVQIGEGDIDFDEIMPLFNDYSGTWVPEIWRGHLHSGQGFLKALKLFNKYKL